MSLIVLGKKAYSNDIRQTLFFIPYFLTYLQAFYVFGSKSSSDVLVPYIDF
jgi:hypothetical protein